MSESVQIIAIVAMLLCFLASLVALVIINPNKVKVKTKKEDSESMQEVCVELDSNEKQKS